MKYMLIYNWLNVIYMIYKGRLHQMKNRLNINKTITTIIVLNAIQIGAIAAIIIYNYISKSGWQSDYKFFNRNLLLIIIILTVFFNSFITIKDMKALKIDSYEHSMLKDNLCQVEELNRTLRAQRHDFMNHLQVVYSLMEMKEYDEAQEYIDKVYNDIQRVNQALRTSNPAINALLQAKRIYGEKRGIEVNLHISSQFKDLRVPSWEFCRILGNIIDNGIYALGEKNGYKAIDIELFEDLKDYGFRISNNGPTIPANITDKIFQSGFTTKGNKGEGMGLAIAKEILNEHGGDIKVCSDEEKTVFEGWVPAR